MNKVKSKTLGAVSSLILLTPSATNVVLAEVEMPKSEATTALQEGVEVSDASVPTGKEVTLAEDELNQSGQFGDVDWQFDEGKLTLTGSEEAENPAVLGTFSFEGDRAVFPWTPQSAGIHEVELSGFISPNPDGSFGGYVALFADLPVTHVEGLEFLQFPEGASLRDMFSGTDLVSVDLSENDLSKVKDIFGMFRDCSALAEVKFPTGENALQEITGMGELFQNCSKLKEIDLTTFHYTSGVAEDKTRNMFLNCTSLEKISLPIGYAFYGGEALPEVQASDDFSGGWTNQATGTLYKSSADFMADFDGAAGTYVWQANQTQVKATPYAVLVDSSDEEELTATFTVADALKPELFDKFGESDSNAHFTVVLTDAEGKEIEGFGGTVDEEVTLSAGHYTAVITHTKEADEDSKTVSSEPIAIDILTETGVSYSTSVQGKWGSAAKDGAVSGTVGESKAMTAFKINLDTDDETANQFIAYRSHIAGSGWESDYATGGNISGSENGTKRIEAIQVRLTGGYEALYDVYYRLHTQKFGWLDWAKNDEVAGSTGYGYRAEAVEIVLVPKGAEAPGKTATPSVNPIVYSTHVQNKGWTKEVRNGATSGTTGQSLRSEAMQLHLSDASYEGSIEYRSHLAKTGWETDFVRDGAVSGTTGESKQQEAIQVRLTGEMAERYDVYYRVHVQNRGWLGWAKNGQETGTVGYGQRIESIQVQLVPKGAKAPGSTGNSYFYKR